VFYKAIPQVGRWYGNVKQPYYKEDIEWGTVAQLGEQVTKQIVGSTNYAFMVLRCVSEARRGGSNHSLVDDSMEIYRRGY